MLGLGHILDDQDLVDTLDKSKKMSGEIEKRVVESEDTQKKIEQARKKYLPVSCYFCHLTLIYYRPILCNLTLIYYRPILCNIHLTIFKVLVYRSVF